MATNDFTPMFGMGNPNDAYAQYFIGNSYLNPLTNPAEAGIGMSNVTFEPGCRNNWHIHHASKGGGQILVCTDGRGWYQEWGKDPQELTPGTVVVIPAGVKHWHGAARDSWFSHIAFEAPGEDTSGSSRSTTVSTRKRSGAARLSPNWVFANVLLGRRASSRRG